MEIKVKECLNILEDMKEYVFEVNYENESNNNIENQVAIDYLIYEILENDKNESINKLLRKIKRNYLMKKLSKKTSR